jgi:RimJ/RimL family protein N-acetyltransferase
VASHNISDKKGSSSTPAWRMENRTARIFARDLSRRSGSSSLTTSQASRPPASLPALALRFPLRAKVVEAKSIIAGEPASRRVRPRLDDESHGPARAAAVDNGEAPDHLNVRREARRRERRLNANRCLNRVAFPIEEADFDREPRGAARAAPDVNQGKDGATPQILDSKRELLGRAALQRGGLGVHGPCQRGRPVRLFRGRPLLHQRCPRRRCCGSGRAKGINRCGDKQGNHAPYDDPGQASADHLEGTNATNREVLPATAFHKAFPSVRPDWRMPRSDGSVQMPAEPLKAPDPPISGTIVRLRPVSAEDHAAVYSACQDAEIQRWTSAPPPYSVDDARSFIEFSQQAWRDNSAATFSILYQGSSEFLGTVNLRLFDDAVAEVGYRVKAEARGRGVATEAVRLLSRWAIDQLGMARVQLGTHPENLASQRVATKAGFQREGVLRSLREIKGERVDQVFFSMLPEDFGD